MKKITSLFMALALVIGLNAQSVQSLKNVQSNQQRFEQRLAQAKTNRERIELRKAYKSYLASRVNQWPAATSKAAKVRKEAQELTIDHVTSTLSVEDGSIFYGLHLEEFAPAFYFDIPVAEGKHDIELGHTYTLEEMNASSCYWDDEEWDSHYYTAATFTKTKGENYDVHIVATITDEKGNEWSLQYDEAPLIPTGEHIDVNIARAIDTQEYIEQDGTWMLRASDNQFGVQLMYYSQDATSPAGMFSDDNISWNETLINVATGELDDWDEPVVETYFAKDGTISVTKNAEGRIDVTASLLFSDGNVYDITLFFELPKKENEATLTAANLNVDTWGLDSWGEVALYAEDENGVYIGLSLYPEDREEYLVSYELNPDTRSSGYISYDQNQYNIYTGTVNLAYEEASEQYVLTGKVLAWDNTEYTLNLRSPLPVITPDTFETEDLILDIYDGAWQIAGFDEAHERFLSIGVYSENVAGTYTEADLEPQVTYLASQEAGYVLKTADLTVAYADGIATVTGTLLLVNQSDEYDLKELTVNVKGHPYVPGKYTETIGLYARGYNEGDGSADIYYSLLTPDSTKLFQFDFPVDRWTADIESDKVYTLDEMVPDYNIIVNYDENAELTFTEATFRKSLLPGDSIAIEATATDTRGNEWTISYAGPCAEFSARSFVSLGQANLFTYEDGTGFEYEMVDIDNTFKCVLSFNLPGQADVEDDEFYTTESFDLEHGSYISLGNDEEIKIVSATFQRETGGGETEINATIRDERGFIYSLSYYDDGFQPTGDTVYLNFDQALAVRYEAEYQQWFLSAENDSLIVSFELNGDETLEIAGDQTGTVSLYGSRIEILVDAEEQNWLWIQLREIETLFVSGEEGNYVLDATTLAENGNVYVVHVEANAEGIEDTHAAIKAIKRLENGQLIIEKNGVRFNAQGVQVR
ncbi:MAG: hypothetical protein IJS82_05935 [Paludibacteraceae bacterium]|nr:hypothetical protein [Paludibacteraceae bacterium]